jgi:hypothetical protein
VPSAVVFVGGWGSPMDQHVSPGAASRGGAVPTDQFALNDAEVTFDTAPAAAGFGFAVLTVSG